MLMLSCFVLVSVAVDRTAQAVIVNLLCLVLQLIQFLTGQ
jgi:hypothetical protein